MSKKKPFFTKILSLWNSGVLIAVALAVCIQFPVAAAFPTEPEQPDPGVTNDLVSLVEDINGGPANSNPQGLTTVDGTLFFSANDGEHGVEFWKSSPPFVTANMVADINIGRDNSDPSRFTSINRTVFFIADDGKFGRELYKSTPPYTSAEMVRDLNPGKNSAFPKDRKFIGSKFMNELLPIGDYLFFAADDGNRGEELWVSQPPYDANSTRMVSDIRWGPEGSNPHELMQVGWTLFFIADDGTNHSEVWKSEIPYTGASRVTNINPKDNANVFDLTPIGETVFFSARGKSDADEDKDSGQELWKTIPPYRFEDAKRVTDIVGKSTSLYPRDLVALGNTLFFSGCVAPVIVKEVKPAGLVIPECGPNYDANIRSILPSLYAIPSIAITTPGTGFELWKSEPPYEATSTYRISDIFPGVRSSNPDYKTVIGSTLIFTAYEQGSGQELYKIVPPYKGENIYRVGEVNKQSGSTPTHYGSSDPWDLTVINQTLFYTASDYGQTGRELYKAEPPYFKAERLTDLMPGQQNSDPQSLQSVGQMLFFNAAGKMRGHELWRFGGPNGYLLPNTGFEPDVMTIINPQPLEKAYTTLGDLWLEIPALGVQSPIVGVPFSEDGWDLAWLGTRIGYINNTAFPTTDGNSVMTGHLYNADGNPGPFVNLQNLKWGDTFFVHAWGQRYIYQVQSVQNISPNDMSVMSHKKESWVTLLTCKDFDQNNNTYQMRTAVQAVLIKVVQDSGVFR